MQALALAAAERRRAASEPFFAAQAERISRLCHVMAERFARGGRLVAFGEGPVARSDARHVAVEFAHPVITGQRALPALALTAEGGPLPAQLKLLAEPEDMALAFGAHPEMIAAVNTARLRGCLTLSGSHVGADWELVPEEEDPFLAQELVETLHHILSELVHVFLQQRGLLKERVARAAHDPRAPSLLYPFRRQGEADLETVLAEVRGSVLARVAEAAELGTQTLCDGEDELREAARAMRSRLDGGGRVLALGNGGSAANAMDAVADLRLPPAGWPPRSAIDLTEDPAIITAIADEAGEDSIFSRQIITHGREEDTLLAFSTSDSRNVLAALAEARQRGLLSVAFVGHDGGRIAAERLADNVISTRSDLAPRIHEAHTSASHVLRELVETPM